MSDSLQNKLQNKKTIRKLEKLENDSANAKDELKKARETTRDTMKQSWEDLELWKQKELAKGKDPEKVEKKYQQGVRTVKRIEERMDRMFDRNETRIDEWNYKGRTRIEKAAHKRVIMKVATSSLSKLEKVLSNNPNTDEKYVIAAYVSIVKKSGVNPVKHPNLLKEITKWENAIKTASKEDDYFKMFLSLVEENNKKDKKKKFKIEAAKKVNQLLEDNNVSIRFLSEYTGIKYANVYNFLKNEIYTDLSFRKTHLLLWSTINLKKGITKEEALKKHIEKMEKLKDYWDSELLDE